MRCEKHPELDAVGNCVYCGRGICDQCKVRVNNLLHCYECATAGRVKGGQQQMQPPPMVPPMYFRPQVPQEPYTPPTPMGTPDSLLFRIGGFGSIYAFIMTIICMIAVPLSLIAPRVLGPVIILFSLSLLPVAVGVHGFYRNYGVRGANTMAMLAVVAAMADLCIGIYMTLMVSSLNLCMFTSWIVWTITGGALLGLSQPIKEASIRVRPGLLVRKDLERASSLMVIAGLLLVVMFGAFIIGWIILAIALNFLMGAFLKAPMPGLESEQPAAVTPTYATTVVTTHEEPPPPRSVNTIVERVDER